MTQLIAHLFGDFIVQSSWMAENKTKHWWPAFIHALLYSLCFVPLCWVAGHWNSTTIEVPVATTAYRLCVNATATAATVYTPEVGCWTIAPSAATSTGKWVSGSFRWLPWLVIFGTHFLIDRYRLARYVVWAKNWLGPWKRERLPREEWGGERDDISGYILVPPNRPLEECPTGYPPETPIWLSTWLLIIADNACHLAINYAALRWL